MLEPMKYMDIIPREKDKKKLYKLVKVGIPLVKNGKKIQIGIITK